MCAFPAALPGVSAPATPGASAADISARGQVLIVEDNDVVAGLITCILNRRGQSVLRARDGAECEQMVAQHGSAIVLVLLDCRLPDTDGISLCGRLRARVPRLPVLLSSGHNYAGPRAVADGPTAFLAKPFLPEQLKRQIDTLLQVAA